MKDSPALSTSRRKSLKLNQDVQDDIPQNDDEAEKQQRRRDSGKFTHLAEQRRSVNTPSSIVEFSAAELVAQYANCLRLSAENKITHKNAFSLPLIDCMKAMLRKKDEQMDNFQFVSCTLDASAKIYASRVDRVHMDGLQFAQGLGAQPRVGSQAAGGDSSGDEGEGQAPVQKKKKLKRKRKIAVDTSKFTMSLDSVVEQDATYTYMRQQFGNCQPGFTSFIPRLALVGDSCQVAMDLRRRLVEPAEPPAPSEDVEISLDRLNDLSTKLLCSSYRNILSSKAADIDYSSVIQPPSEVNGTVIDDDDDDDDNDVDMGAVDMGSPCDVPGDATEDPMSIAGFSDTMVTAGSHGIACRAAGVDAPIRVVDLHHTALMQQSGIAGEDAMAPCKRLERLLWAGPAHWQHLPLFKGKDGSKDGQAEAPKKRERKVVPIDFNSFQEIDLKGSRKNTLTRQYMENNWSIEKVTNPVDLHIDPLIFTRLFLRPQVGIQVATRSGREPKISPHVEDLPEYNYDNLNDSQSFCPDITPDGSFGDNDDTGTEVAAAGLFGQPAGDVHTVAALTVDGDWQLVDPPQKVARITVGFAQHAKKVDMKKLKWHMWKILTEEKPKDKQVEGQSSALPEDDFPSEMKLMTQIIQFSVLFKRLMKTVPADMAAELSMPLVLCGLLHLANEKVLTLKNSADFSDITISQDRLVIPFLQKQHKQKRYK